jgi:tetratricopeptide (TPR) repeat protein
MDEILKLCQWLKRNNEPLLHRFMDRYVSNKEHIYTELKMLDYANSILIEKSDVRSKIALGKNYNDMHEFDKAYDVLIKIDTENSYDSFYKNHALAIALYYSDYQSNAYEILFALLDYDLPDVILNQAKPALANYYFKKNDFKKAIEYMHVSDDPVYPGTYYWNGVITPGLKITIGFNGGIGDQIVCARFYKHFEELGMIPYINTNNPHLKFVFENNGFKCIDEFTGVVCNIIGNSCDIPYLLKLDKDKVWYGPYLKPSIDSIIKFKNCNGIGVQWSGDNDYAFHDTRYVEINDLIQVLPKDINKYSLNVVDSTEHLIDMRSQLKTIDDTMGLIYNLDYIITSDTSVAHMAAAMGKKVFVLVPVSGFYTWSMNVWYESVHCYYQKSFKKWDYSDIKMEVERWLSN